MAALPLALPACTPQDTMALFSWQDYSVLASALIVSCAVGLFYGFCKKEKAAEGGDGSDFLLGGASMPALPMAISLAASFITAVELLGNTAEMYANGSQFWMSCLAFIFVVPVTSQLYLPVYRELKLTSAYEYLELRFGQTARTIGAAMYVMQMTLYTSVAVYAPALALSHVTGLNTYIAVTCVYAVCILYSSQGGMRAVIITDTFQSAVLIGSILLVLFLGNYHAGGLAVVWARSSATQRLEFFNMDPSPMVRHSFWSVVVGGTFYWATMFCSNQASVQKYMSVAAISQVRRALWISCAALALIFTANFYTGMVIYADYHGCDPLTTKVISASDQLLPLYVMTFMGHLKGVPGLFVAGIFSASLGTVAAALNSLAAVTVSDFLTGALPSKWHLPAEKIGIAAKWTSVAFGLLSFALVFVVERLGGVLQVALSFNGMVGGVTLGMFSLGMFFPWANTKGVLMGALTAFVLVAWIGIGAHVTAATETSPKYTSADYCNCTNNSASLETILHSISSESNLSRTSQNEEVFSLYRISYLWYSAIGCTTTVLVGLIISIITGPQDPGALDSRLLSPPVKIFLENLPEFLRRKLSITISDDNKKTLPKRRKKNSMCAVYDNGILNVAINLEDEKVGSASPQQEKSETETKSLPRSPTLDNVGNYFAKL